MPGVEQHLPRDLLHDRSLYLLGTDLAAADRDRHRMGERPRPQILLDQDAVVAELVVGDPQRPLDRRRAHPVGEADEDRVATSSEQRPLLRRERHDELADVADAEQEDDPDPGGDDGEHQILKGEVHTTEATPTLGR